jgi:hypothetical protein
VEEGRGRRSAHLAGRREDVLGARPVAADLEVEPDRVREALAHLPGAGSII